MMMPFEHGKHEDTLMLPTLTGRAELISYLFFVMIHFLNEVFMFRQVELLNSARRINVTLMKLVTMQCIVDVMFAYSFGKSKG